MQERRDEFRYYTILTHLYFYDVKLDDFIVAVHPVLCMCSIKIGQRVIPLG